MTKSVVCSQSDKDLESTTSRTAGSLLKRARDSDQEAWRRMVRLYSPLIYRWCRGWGLQEADAAEIGQDVFRSVALGLADFKHDEKGSSFRGWLRSMTRSKVADCWAAKLPGHGDGGGSEAYERLQQLSWEKAEPQDLTLSEELQILFWRALEIIQSEFTEIQWQAFRRNMVDQQRAADVAQELGIAREVVYNVRSRILRRLREEFGDLIDIDSL